jgi:hypothetical protein
MAWCLAGLGKSWIASYARSESFLRAPGGSSGDLCDARGKLAEGQWCGEVCVGVSGSVSTRCCCSCWSAALCEGSFSH